MKNKEPAFPTKFNVGMSLRDWFAGMALQGMLANGGGDHTLLPQKTYKIADAMLKEREVQDGMAYTGSEMTP
jgi:hypothetical protein